MYLKESALNNLERFRLHSSLLILSFLSIIIISMLYNISSITKKQNQFALEHAKTAFINVVMFRNWVSSHGGVYVFPTKTTPPNPYLAHLKDRDLITTEGRKLTLMNPAYASRELMENFSGMYGEKGHITSLKLLNPNNKAGEWETKVLKNFDKKKYTEYHEIYNYKNKEHLRYMKALKVTENCLKCHRHQDYKIGETRGGISITIPMEKYNNNGFIEKKYIIVLHIVIIVFGLIIAFIIYDKIAESIKNENKFIKEQKQKDALLFQQSKMASMGEMIGNIAHQWRQPLSVISVAVTGVKFRMEFQTLDDDTLNESLDNISNSVQNLSQIIDDFRGFFKPNKSKEEFLIKGTFEKVFKLLTSQFKIENITIVQNIEEIYTFGFENELIQVLINIINNARDELVKKENKQRLILIDVVKNNKNVEITIKDNAGGIPVDIIGKIFDSHFTTKKDATGTGIGLYMSKMIIEHMDGTIDVSNETFIYEGNSYEGACFKISFPIYEGK